MTTPAVVRSRSDLLTTVEAAEFLRRQPQTLAYWRCAGKGPPYVKAGAGVRYRLSDLEAWLATNTVTPEGAD